jgi:Phage portal protein, SPP1 Gp6-like
VIVEDVELALANIAARAPLIRLRKDYRAGHHRLAFATEQFRSTFGQVFRAFALNLCPMVVDSVADRLQITGFTDSGSEGGELEAAGALWEASLMEARAGELHGEALTAGDGYLIVWPDEGGMPLLYPQAAEQCWVRYDDEQPGRLRFAAKTWCPLDGPTAGHRRLSMYYPDRVERYVSEKAEEAIPDKPSKLRPLAPAEGGAVTPHAWEVVPVFHFPNDAAPGHYGASRLDDAIPINDALNKTVLDLLVGSEAQALPQRWVAGTLGDETDPATGRPAGVAMPAGAILELGAEQARAGQFDAADLRQLVEVKESFALDMARVTKTPLHLLKQSGDWPSGEALRTAEAPLVKECRDRIAAWGPVWASAMELALRMGQLAPEGQVRTLYEPPETRASEMEIATTAEAKQRAGIPREVTWREMGYSDEQIEEMSAMLAEQKAQDIERAQFAFNRGAGMGGGQGAEAEDG